MSNKEVSDAAHTENIAATSENGVLCRIDDVWVHSVPAYLKRMYSDVTPEAYQEQFPGAALFSPALEEKRAQKVAKKAAEEATMNAAAAVIAFPNVTPQGKPERKSFSDVFGLGNAKAAKNKRGDAIMISVLANDPHWQEFVPDLDPNYIFNIDLLKALMMAIEINKPMLLWGFHGTGKSTLPEQYCHRTNRPMIRVQHTIGTEEAHVLGQFLLRDGQTFFNPGPLAMAMRYGWVYLADEYDFALPSVTSVYQPVLEGKSLIIKDACPEWRVVKPHPNFRFIATGNTNGAGDETGLYQGTQMQNAANYSRFAITENVPYMEPGLEANVVAAQGGIHHEDAERLVKVAGMIREGYMKGDLGVTVSPRELINAATWGRVLGGEWKQGLALAYCNRLNSVDREAVNSIIQRVMPASL